MKMENILNEHTIISRCNQFQIRSDRKLQTMFATKKSLTTARKDKIKM